MPASTLDTLRRPSDQTRTIRAELERLRLRHRARRMEHVIKALRGRADVRATRGQTLVPLRHAIESFSRELAQIRRRLEHL